MTSKRACSSTGSFLGGCRRMCSDLVTDGADRDEPVGELIDGAKQRLSYVPHTLGHCSCIRKSRRERATAASFGASSQAATPCSVRTEAWRGMSGASDERVRRGWSGVGVSICHQPPPSSATARVGRHENFSNFSASRSRCIYTALAVIPSSEIKIWCLSYQGEITLNDPTNQDDKPCLPYALTLRAFQKLAATYRTRQFRTATASESRADSPQGGLV